MLKRVQRKGLFIFKGLIADRKSQFRWALTSALVTTLPASLCVMLLLARLSAQARSMGDAGEPTAAISTFVVSYCQDSAVALATIFAGLGGLAFLLSLRTSSSLIGPVRRLEGQVQNLIEGKPGVESVLRKGDYLKKLSDRLNILSRRLSMSAPKQVESPVEEPSLDQEHGPEEKVSA